MCKTSAVVCNRLQVKGKYQELAPILKKVNQVSVERKRYENEIKRLLQELEKTKQKFSASHQNFKNLVEELIRKKETIDQRLVQNSEKLIIVLKHRSLSAQRIVYLRKKRYRKVPFYLPLSRVKTSFRVNHQISINCKVVYHQQRQLKRRRNCC